MGENSKIEWTDHTFNPWIGCTKVAAGCANCYAESLAKRTGLAKWGDDGTRTLTTDANWQKPLRWNAAAKDAGVRFRVFCASLADVFEGWNGQLTNAKGFPIWWNDVTGIEYQALPGRSDQYFREYGSVPYTLKHARQRLFELIDATPYLDWLLLTKRPENIPAMWPHTIYGTSDCDATNDHKASATRSNVWLGTSVSTTADLVRNVHYLAACRALSPVLFLSMEPLLERIDLLNDYPSEEAVDWIIVGGESGHKSRPMEHRWVEKLRRDSVICNIPFFFKQWGGADKAAAGRELDGVTISEMPRLKVPNG